MSALTNFTGLAGIALAITATALSLPGMARLPQHSRLGLACGVALAVLISFDGLPLAAYVRAATGDLSITTQLMLVLAIWRRAGCAPAVQIEAGRQALLLLIVCAALLLYPMALGHGLFDPYRLGYGSVALIFALLLVALAAWWRQLHLAALAISLAVLAWSLGWMESPNLWDYLLDPLLAIYAAGALAGYGLRRLRGSNQSA